VDDGTDAGLALHDDVWDTHLAAESWEENDELDRVNIVSDDDEGCLLGLNEGDDMVKTILDKQGLLGVLYQQVSESNVDYKLSQNQTFSLDLSSAAAAAVATRRAFFSCLLSGRYLLRSLNS